MPSPGDMFRSYGSIRVLLVEADEGSKSTRSEHVDSKFFVTVSLVDKESSTLGKFSSACQYFSSSLDPCKIDEEFLFDGVSSAHSLLISLSIIGDRSASNCQRTTIPVSRLEEDTEVVTRSILIIFSFTLLWTLDEFNVGITDYIKTSDFPVVSDVYLFIDQQQRRNGNTNTRKRY